MSASAPPPPPSADSLISAQNKANETARQQNMVGQQGPVGNISYTKNPDGTFTAHTALSAPQQALLSENQAVGRRSLNEANDVLAGQYQKAPDITGTTNSLDSTMLGGYIKSMNPFFDQQNENQDAKLAAMGLNPDSQAAELARMNLGRTQDAAITGAAAQFLPQAQNMAINAYELPLQTASGLANLGRPSMAQPNNYAASTAGAVQGPTQAGSLMNQAYQNQVQQTQAANQAANAPWQMAATLAGTALGGPMGGQIGSALGNSVFGGAPATTSGWEPTTFYGSGGVP